MVSFEARLSGGPINAKGDAAAVIAEVEASPTLLAALMETTFSKDEIARWRAVYCLEMLARRHPDWVPSIQDRLLGLMSPDEFWSIRMDVARLAPKGRWSDEEYKRVLDFLFREAEGEFPFVKAWALDSLSQLAVKDETIRPRVVYLLEEGIEAGRASVRARCRQALKRLGKG